ncbi:2'-5' RNA ligase [Rubritalea squalenifaciens DSM 18772]|uniref:RNA 2',3'-cyclic phosphodiesterase n=1 Tax=Rubritalea squalenifaciens DSM 18772 TaxID=1123071 RepID=A0A1M6R921_9BACT|nr:RNA 2',3'-cyclic phosphodiesterase [Rubritalea squalenifaciens]SHK28979.1 2'-5' RNA ligase [Rubritalea squalenifaciens DSM 18772]
MGGDRERLFLAIQLPESIRHDLSRLREEISGCRWVPAKNLHLTLRFLGDCDHNKRARLSDALQSVRARELKLGLNKLGVFSKRGALSVLWLGAEQVDESLVDLKVAIDEALFQVGFDKDHWPYKAHVTLARLRNVKRGDIEAYIRSNSGAVKESFPVRFFSLMRSLFSEGAVRYEEVCRYPLDG